MAGKRIRLMLVSRTSLLLHRSLAMVVMFFLACSIPASVQAQNLFAPVRQVNDRIITNFDVEQRMSFMTILNAGAADMRAEALTRLTQEAVQRDFARRLNLRVDRDELAEGMSEFAARADLSAEEFVTALAANGVERESFEGFVEAGLLWRKVVARQFPQLISVTDADLARTRDIVAIVGRERVLLSEIFLPTDPQFAEPVAQIMDLIAAADGNVEEFSSIAREFSLAGSRDQGGRLPDWVPIENLPGQIAGLLSAASPGQIIGPIEMSPEAIAYFQLRARDSSRDIPADRVKLSYKRLSLPDAGSEATRQLVQRIMTETRSCPELGRFARGLPETALVEREGLVNEIPQIDAVELARLDQNQISANATEGGRQIILMLCSRELEFEDAPSDARLRDIVFDRRLNAMSEVKLQELVADADIRDF